MKFQKTAKKDKTSDRVYIDCGVNGWERVTDAIGMSDFPSGSLDI